MRKTCFASLGMLACLVFLVQPAVAASSLGSLSGTVRDSEGHPLADLLIALAAKSAGHALPVLARTDEAGRLMVRDLEAGLYELGVKSSAYQSPEGRLVEIEPGKTIGIHLVLQQLITLGSSAENAGLKSILRTSADRRLIFRTTPDNPTPAESGPSKFFDKAAIQVKTGSAEAFAFPGDVWGGTTTNFAVKDRIGDADYIVAGQFTAGPDTMWRVRNFLDYGFTDGHLVRISMGYGKYVAGQTTFAGVSRDVSDPLQPDGDAIGKMVGVGIEDRWRFGDSFSVFWGFDLNQVRYGETELIASPSAGAEINPLPGTAVRFLLASKRATDSNMVSLPGEENIQLDDPVFLSFRQDEPEIGTARFYQASVSQQLGDSNQVEVAAYESHFFGAATPLVAMVSPEGETGSFQFSEDLAWSRGVRFSFSRRFNDNFRAKFSYLAANAVGLEEDTTVLMDRNDLADLFRRKGYHALAAEIEAYMPSSGTRLQALVKKVVEGNSPVTKLDPLSDFHETANQGINLFVRQLVPVPSFLIEFLGLDFLLDYRFEALFDVRNLTNEQLGVLRTAAGDLVLLQHPRTFRGGIAVNF